MSARERICEAMIDAVLEDGYGGTTVEAVCERAGVDRATFAAEFAGKEACFMAVFDEYTELFNTMVFDAYRAEPRWRDGIRAAAYAAAAYIEAYPRQARFGVNAMFDAGPVAQAHREAHLQKIVDLIDAGRRELDDPESMGRGVAEAALGSIYSSLVREMSAGEVKSARNYVPELLYIAVRPYLGHDVAREEQSIPPPPRVAEASQNIHVQAREALVPISSPREQ